MARRNMDWHTGWWSESFLNAVDQQVVLTLINDAELLGYEDDLIVERVIGQIMIVNTTDVAGGTQTALFHLRMTVRPEDNAGQYTFSSVPFGNADEQFMWHKVLAIASGGVNNMATICHPEWSHIDVRVNRRLQGLERLVLTIDPLGLQGSVSYSVAAWLRVLVKT